MFFLLWMFFLSPSLFSVSYKTVKGGLLGVDSNGAPDPTGFVTLYEESDQDILRVEVGSVLKREIAVPTLEDFTLFDINHDGIDDVFMIYKDPGEPLDQDSTHIVYHKAAQLWESHVVSKSDSQGKIYKDVEFDIGLWGDLSILKAAGFQHYQRVLMDDVDRNGSGDFLYVAWVKTAEGYSVYWMMSEKVYTQGSFVVEYKGEGTLLTQSLVEDVFFLKGVHYNYLAIQTAHTIDIYQYIKTPSSFKKVKSVIINSSIDKVIPIDAPEHPLLSKYNMLILSEKKLFLRYESEEDEQVIPLSLLDRKERESEGYVLGDIYTSSSSSDGRFAVWWFRPNGEEGDIGFYRLSEQSGSFELQIETQLPYAVSFFPQKPMGLAYRSANETDHGAWRVINCDSSWYHDFNYDEAPSLMEMIQNNKRYSKDDYVDLKRRGKR